jgi:hypothetical protein
MDPESIKAISAVIGVVGVAFAIAWMFRGFAGK